MLESVEECAALRRLIELCGHTLWFRLTSRGFVKIRAATADKRALGRKITAILFLVRGVFSAVLTKTQRTLSQLEVTADRRGLFADRGGRTADNGEGLEAVTPGVMELKRIGPLGHPANAPRTPPIPIIPSIGVMRMLESVEECAALRRLIELCGHTLWFRLTSRGFVKIRAATADKRALGRKITAILFLVRGVFSAVLTKTPRTLSQLEVTADRRGLFADRGGRTADNGEGLEAVTPGVMELKRIGPLGHPANSLFRNEVLEDAQALNRDPCQRCTYDSGFNGSISILEVRNAILKAKHGKAVGVDEIPAEVLKNDTNVTFRLFMFNSDKNDTINRNVSKQDPTCHVQLGELGCNYCQALNTNMYKCAWDKANGCTFNDTVGELQYHVPCPSPIIDGISPKDVPWSGTVIVTLTGKEFGLETDKFTEVIVSGKSVSHVVANNVYASVGPPDFMLQVRIGSMRTLVYVKENDVFR
ncbi:hypothetical protein DPMN_188867 [Dreissena polymorpha]|uniref:IPT/TIG domain-containing protein n=1 Tax=Dreissena polymorpha TaxID=45954 RepID=A0A9D4DSF2_DREPO|nr:hypothetical protein DPMN_188867 [Dreissena polymorpha]